MVTEIRMCVSSSEEVPPIEDLIEKTDILKFMLQCLGFQSEDELSTYIKLEAIWILTNLSVSENEDTIASFFDQEQEPTLISLIENGL